MNAAETIALCRLVRAYCPAQHFDDYTPEAWLDLLGDLRFEDCREAAANIGRREPFISPADIRKEVRAIRDNRIAKAPPFTPPPGIEDDEVAQRRALADYRRRIADGEHVAPVAELPPRPMRAIEGTFPRVEDA